MKIIALLLWSYTWNQFETNQVKHVASDYLHAYDCNNPTSISVHKIANEEDCNTRLANTKTEEEERYYQILQKSETYKIEGHACSAYVSTKTAFCGTYSHALPYYWNDSTNIKINIPTDLCKRFIRKRKATTGDIQKLLNKTITQNAVSFKLKLNRENILKAYLNGAYQYSEFNDVNCGFSKGAETKTKIPQFGVDYMAETSNIVIFKEVKLIIRKTNLIATQDTIIDPQADRVLRCKPQTEECSDNLDTFYWKNIKPTCDFYHVGFTQGKLVKVPEGNFEEEKYYYIGNDSVIYMQIGKPIEACGKTVLETDVRGIFLLRGIPFDLGDSPINQTLPTSEISILKDVQARDAFVFRKLFDLLQASTQAIKLQHCLDIKFHQFHLSYIVTTGTDTDIKPIKISSSGKFAFILGEVAYKIKCTKKLVRPVYLGQDTCYAHLPVITVDASGSPINPRETMFFLKPQDRLLIPLSQPIDCHSKYRPYYQTEDKKYIAYTSRGIIQVPTPSKPLAWTPNVSIELEIPDLHDKAIYDYDAMTEALNPFLTSFYKKQTLLAAMSENLDTKTIQKGSTSIWSYLSHMTMDAFDLKSKIKSMGSYFGFFLFVTCMLMGLYQSCLYCYGCKFICNQETPINQKILYAASPQTFLLQREQNAVYLDQAQVKEIVGKDRKQNNKSNTYMQGFNLFDDSGKQ